jgi:hypothetical protein
MFLRRKSVATAVSLPRSHVRGDISTESSRKELLSQKQNNVGDL